MFVGTILFMGSIGFPEIVIGLVIFWIPVFYIARAIFKRKVQSHHVNTISAITGLLISPILFAGFIVLTVWVITSF